MAPQNRLDLSPYHLHPKGMSLQNRWQKNTCTGWNVLNEWKGRWVQAFPLNRGLLSLPDSCLLHSPVIPPWGRGEGQTPLLGTEACLTADNSCRPWRPPQQLEAWSLHGIPQSRVPRINQCHTERIVYVDTIYTHQHIQHTAIHWTKGPTLLSQVPPIRN